ncbi:MAG: hypothetical protein EZS28_035348, partial [Streblomastix strix]
MNTWMEDQENVAKLVISDNLYFVDKKVMDYQQDGTVLKVLEIQLPDMKNVITTLGTATGGCNAITDISIDGNTLKQAKNIAFVTTRNYQSITGMKTFTNTTISIDIQYQGRDNNSVFLADGGVKTISDINVSTTQIINANKTFNNNCRFVCSIDGMSTVTESSFIKLRADNTVVLLGAGVNKPISEFVGGSADDSNYVKKTGKEPQLIHGVLRRSEEEVSMSKDEDDYLTRAEIYKGFVSRSDIQTIYGTKTFKSNVNAGFVKSGADNTVVLLGVGNFCKVIEIIVIKGDGGGGGYLGKGYGKQWPGQQNTMRVLNFK